MGGVIEFCACRLTPLLRRASTRDWFFSDHVGTPPCLVQRRVGGRLARSLRGAREPTPVAPGRALRRFSRTGSRSNLLSGRPERHPSSHPGLGRYDSTPPRRSPLRRRSDRHPEPLAHLGGRTLGRSLKSPEVTADFGQHVYPGSLATRYRFGGTARRRCRTRGFGPARRLFARPRSRPRLLSRTAARHWLRPRRVRDTAKGPPLVGPHPRVRSGRRASTDLRVRRVRETAFGRRLGGMWHALTRCKRRILPRA
jgi:hypothetical protein